MSSIFREVLRHQIDAVFAAQPAFVQGGAFCAMLKLEMAGIEAFLDSADISLTGFTDALNRAAGSDFSDATAFEQVSGFEFLTAGAFNHYGPVAKQVNAFRAALSERRRSIQNSVHFGADERQQWLEAIDALTERLFSLEGTFANAASVALAAYSELLQAALTTLPDETAGGVTLSESLAKIDFWLKDAEPASQDIQARLEAFADLAADAHEAELNQLFQRTRDLVETTEQDLISSWRRYVLVLPLGQLTKLDVALGERAFQLAAQVYLQHALAAFLKVGAAQ